MPTDFFSPLVNEVQRLVTTHMGIFIGMGRRLFVAFAIIHLAWFGIQSALASAEGSGGPNLAAFSRLMMLIAFGYAMVSGYDSPIPGLGVSLVDLVVGQTNYLSGMIGQQAAQEVSDGATALIKKLSLPTLALLTPLVFVYFIVFLLLGLVIAATVMVIGFGVVAQGVLVLVGPIFVPFFIVPKLEWLFWGWFRCFLQYSFYRVIATAYLYVFGTFLAKYFLTLKAASLGEWVTLLPVFLIYVVTFLYGILKIPTLTAHLFSGSSGADSGLVQSVVGVAKGAATTAIAAVPK